MIDLASSIKVHYRRMIQLVLFLELQKKIKLRNEKQNI